jgi:hypothetical protein
VRPAKRGPGKERGPPPASVWCGGCHTPRTVLACCIAESLTAAVPPKITMPALIPGLMLLRYWLTTAGIDWGSVSSIGQPAAR